MKVIATKSATSQICKTLYTRRLDVLAFYFICYRDTKQLSSADTFVPSKENFVFCHRSLKKEKASAHLAHLLARTSQRKTKSN